MTFKCNDCGWEGSEELLQVKYQPNPQDVGDVTPEAVCPECGSWDVDAIRPMMVHDYHYQTTYTSGTCPQIRIRGKYLEKAGFGIGEKISVSVSANQIVIRKGGGNRI